MKQKPIAVLKKLFAAEKVSEQEITSLRTDERKGVQRLLKAHENKKIQEKILKKNFIEMCSYEEENFAKGYQLIAGVDEAGRGPLAGPVVAAAVILPRSFKLLGLTDSKKLSKNTRNEFFKTITKQAIDYSISIISNDEIDQINILEATKRAMHHCLDQLDPKPEHVLIDAVDLGPLQYTSEVIIKGDLKSITIAAASVLAKVTRDRLMEEIHTDYPVYKFASNMGYGTKDHLKMLDKHGISPYHRKSFAPVRNVMDA